MLVFRRACKVLTKIPATRVPGVNRGTESIAEMRFQFLKYMTDKGNACRQRAHGLRLSEPRWLSDSCAYQYRHQSYFCSYPIEVTICVTGLCAAYPPPNRRTSVPN